MKLNITGIGSYDLEEILKNASLNDLYYLKVKTRTEEYPLGVSMKSLGSGMQKWADFEDPSDILNDAEALLNLRSLVYLCRRHVGEKVTIDTANDFPLSAFSFETEDDEDPQGALPGSGQGAETPESPTTPTTSRHLSTDGFPSSPTSGLG